MLKLSDVLWSDVSIDEGNTCKMSEEIYEVEYGRSEPSMAMCCVKGQSPLPVASAFGCLN